MKNLKTLEELEIADPIAREILETFCEEYDFDKVPRVYHQGEEKDPEEWNIDWRDDIRFDESWNAYLPEYEIRNFKDNSESPSGENGYNYVPDTTYDVEKEYNNPEINYQQIKNWFENN